MQANTQSTSANPQGSNASDILTETQRLVSLGLWLSSAQLGGFKYTQEEYSSNYREYTLLETRWQKRKWNIQTRPPESIVSQIITRFAQ